MKRLITLAAFAAILVAHAPAQSHAVVASIPQNPFSVSITYSALHTNAPVGGCGCFWSQGGSAELAVPVWRFVSAVGELSGERATQIPGYGAIGLSLVSYLAGVRVSHPVHKRYDLFAQSLFGGVHAFDSEFPSTNALLPKATSFAMAAGAGVDIPIAGHVLIRPVQADYQYMQLPNNSTNQQHDIRLSGGIVFRFF
jgi:outer membrane immunogenic protein